MIGNHTYLAYVKTASIGPLCVLLTGRNRDVMPIRTGESVASAREAVPEGGMMLTVLGSGSAFSRSYGTTCSLLRLAEGQQWLIDCGRQAPDQLWACGMTWWDIAGQIVTHVHGDHAYGLEDFALMRYYGGPDLGPSILAGGPRPSLIAHSAVLSEIWEVLGPSLRYRSDAARQPVEGVLDHYFSIAEPSSTEKPKRERWNHSETFSIPGLRLTLRETRHIPYKPSVSLEINLDATGESIAWWGGDSTVDHEYLGALEPRTSVFFHDCTFLEQSGHIHGAFSDLRLLPPSVRRKMVLMHHDDDLQDHIGEALDLGFRFLLPGMQCHLQTGQLADRRAR